MVYKSGTRDSAPRATSVRRNKCRKYGDVSHGRKTPAWIQLSYYNDNNTRTDKSLFWEVCNIFCKTVVIINIFHTFLWHSKGLKHPAYVQKDLQLFWKAVNRASCVKGSLTLTLSDQQAAGTVYCTNVCVSGHKWRIENYLKIIDRSLLYVTAFVFTSRSQVKLRSACHNNRRPSHDFDTETHRSHVPSSRTLCKTFIYLSFV
jgi:hypothetical protein